MDTPRTNIIPPNDRSIGGGQFLAGYPAVQEALNDVRNTLQEHHELLEQSRVFSKELEGQYRDIILQEGYYDTPLSSLTPEQKEIVLRTNCFRDHSDSYAHSVKLVELTLASLDQKNIVKLKGELESLFSLADVITEENNKQGNYCQNMKKCLTYANSNTLVSDDHSRESGAMEGIKQQMPLEMEKAHALADSIRALETVVQQSGLMDALDAAIALERQKKPKPPTQMQAVLLDDESKQQLNKAHTLIKEFGALSRATREARFELEDTYREAPACDDAMQAQLTEPGRLLRDYRDYADYIELNLGFPIESLLREDTKLSTQAIKQTYKDICGFTGILYKFIAITQQNIKQVDDGVLLLENGADREKETLHAMKQTMQQHVETSYELAGALASLESSVATGYFHSGAIRAR